MVKFNSDAGFPQNPPKGDFENMKNSEDLFHSSEERKERTHEKSYSCELGNESDEPEVNRLPFAFNPFTVAPQNPIESRESQFMFPLGDSRSEELSEIPSMLLDHSNIARELVGSDSNAHMDSGEESEESVENQRSSIRLSEEYEERKEEEEVGEPEELERSIASRASSSRIAPVLQSFRNSLRRSNYRNISEEFARLEAENNPGNQQMEEVERLLDGLEENSNEIIMRDENSDAIIRLIPVRRINLQGELMNLGHELLLMGRTIIILNTLLRQDTALLSHEEVLQIKLGGHSVQQILDLPQFSLAVRPQEERHTIDNCVICYSGYLERNKKSPGCPGNHMFHGVCLAKWIQEKRAVICPLCKWTRS